MPWRLGPRAALAIGLPGAFALTAASGMLRTPNSDSPRPTSAAIPSAPIGSIDDTLTRDADGCARVRSTVWHPLSGVEYTGRLRITLPPRHGGAIILFIGDSVPLDVEAETARRVPLGISRERLTTGPGVHLPPDFWLEDQVPWNAPREVVRVTADARGEDKLSFVLRLGRRAPRVLARLVGYPPDVKVPVCADPVREGERYFGTGWYGEERTTDGAIRWMREGGAVLVASARGRETRVRIRAAPAVASDVEGATTLTLRVNDVLELPPVAMRPGLADYEWSVPDAAWVAGTNELFFTVSRVERRGARTLGLALASLHAE
ncbi:MAG TPA: hypothetical protein VMO26_09800 [Vicinamibacterales bacterium]|nr:hypothetical protein [Vicinamibacterales bacterium]